MFVRDKLKALTTPSHNDNFLSHAHTIAQRDLKYHQLMAQASNLVPFMTADQHNELLAIIGMAGKTNHLVTALQVPVDDVFKAK